jgi:hypothetical protein
LRRGPVERSSVTCPFLKRCAIDGYRLLEAFRSTLTFTEQSQYSTEIVLRRSPFKRYAVVRPFLERRAIGRCGLLQPRRPALTLAKPQEHIAESAVG